MIYLKTVEPATYPLFRHLVIYGYKYLYPTSSNGRLGQILNHRAEMLIKDTLKMLGMLFLGGCLFLFYPLILILIKEEFSPLVPLNLPGINPSSELGISINNLHVLAFIAGGVVGIYAIEITNSLMINNIWAGMNIIKYYIDDLEKWNGRRDSEAVHNRTEMIKNIARQTQDINE